MTSESNDDALEQLAAAELLKEAERGRQRAETFGVGAWKNRTNRPNKVFLARSLTSALKQTRYQDESKSRNKEKIMKRSRAEEFNSKHCYGDEEYKSKKRAKYKKESKQTLHSYEQTSKFKKKDKKHDGSKHNNTNYVMKKSSSSLHSHSRRPDS